MIRGLFNKLTTGGMSVNKTPDINKIRSQSFKTSQPLLGDARHVRESYMNILKQQSNGEYVPGHPVYGEILSPTEYKIMGVFSHNFKNKIATQILPGSIDPNSIDQRPQWVHFFKEDIIVPINEVIIIKGTVYLTQPAWEKYMKQVEEYQRAQYLD